MKLKQPDKFLAMALPLFPFDSFKALRVSLFYVGCFVFHYPEYSIPILIITLKVYRNKMLNALYQERLDIYSPQAQEARDIFQKAYDRLEQSIE